MLNVCIDPSDRVLLALHADGTVRGWNLATRTLIDTVTGTRALPATRAASIAAAFTRDGERVAVNFGEAWHTDTFRACDLTLLTRSKSLVLGAVAFAPSGDALVEAAKWAGLIRVTPVGSARPQAESSLGPWFFSDSDLSADGTLLATSWSDPTVFVFDIEQRETVLELSRHTGSVTSIRFSRDAKRLITASKDGTAIVWPVDVYAEAGRRLPGTSEALLRHYRVDVNSLTQAGALPAAAQK